MLSPGVRRLVCTSYSRSFRKQTSCCRAASNLPLLVSGPKWKVSGGYLRYVTSYLGGQFANLCGLGASAPTATTSYDKRRGPVDLVEELVVL